MFYEIKWKIEFLYRWSSKHNRLKTMMLLRNNKYVLVDCSIVIFVSSLTDNFSATLYMPNYIIKALHHYFFSRYSLAIAIPKWCNAYTCTCIYLFLNSCIVCKWKQPKKTKKLPCFILRVSSIIGGAHCNGRKRELRFFPCDIAL